MSKIYYAEAGRSRRKASKKIYYCAYCGEISDRGCIQKCRSCTRKDP